MRRAHTPLGAARGVGLRRAQHERMPSLATYTGLRAAAEAVDAWELERDAARAALRRRDLGGLVDAAAQRRLTPSSHGRLRWRIRTGSWVASVAAPGRKRETQSPADALAVTWRVVDDMLQETDRHAYAAAVKILKRARTAAQTAGERDAFTRDLARLRERLRRRPTLIAMLDKADLR